MLYRHILLLHFTQTCVHVWLKKTSTARILHFHVNDPIAKMENNKNIVKVARLRFDPKTANNGFPSSIMSLCMHPHYRLSLNYYELNQESLHCTERDPPILFVSKIFCLRHVMGEILVRKLIHFDTVLFISHPFISISSSWDAEIRNRSKSDRGSLDNPS